MSFWKSKVWGLCKWNGMGLVLLCVGMKNVNDSSLWMNCIIRRSLFCQVFSAHLKNCKGNGNWKMMKCECQWLPHLNSPENTGIWNQWKQTTTRQQLKWNSQCSLAHIHPFWYCSFAISNNSQWWKISWTCKEDWSLSYSSIQHCSTRT